MKTIILLFIIFFTGCNSNYHDKVRAFIPGTYVAIIDHEFSKGNDTMVISVMDYEANLYQLVRNTSYQRILDGRLFPMERKLVKSIATYEKDSNTFIENGNYATISFSINTSTMYIGSSPYKKIENFK